MPKKLRVVVEPPKKRYVWRSLKALGRGIQWVKQKQQKTYWVFGTSVSVATQNELKRRFKSRITGDHRPCFVGPEHVLEWTDDAEWLSCCKFPVRWNNKLDYRVPRYFAWPQYPGNPVGFKPAIQDWQRERRHILTIGAHTHDEHCICRRPYVPVTTKHLPHLGLNGPKVCKGCRKGPMGVLIIGGNYWHRLCHFWHHHKGAQHEEIESAY